MTRRVALAILAVVWTALVLGSVVAYLAVRGVLLADLDRSLEARALSLPELTGGEAPLPLHADDRYLVADAIGTTMARSGTSAPAQLEVERTDARFVRLPGGQRLRRLTLAVTAPDGRPLTVIFSGSAASFDRVLRRLAVVLGVLGLVTGSAAAWVAVRVSRAALRPLESTAAVIGSIDERSLGRRIDEAALPPELQAMAQRLNEMLTRLEQSRTARQRFMADASHELRTPVSALVTALEVALRRPRDAEQLRQTLETCLADARLLRDLVERLLEQVRSDAGGGREAEADVALRPLAEQCVRIVQPLAERAEVALVVEVPAELHLRTRPAQLRNVLMNLIANAIEYNRPGGRVVVRAQPEGREMRIEVSDSGIGIAAEHLPHLFDPFYRVDPARSGAEGSHLGMGLFLVQSNLQAMGGRCDVSSQIGQGTTFTIRLPVDGQNGDAPPAA